MLDRLGWVLERLCGVGRSFTTFLRCTCMHVHHVLQQMGLSNKRATWTVSSRTLKGLGHDSFHVACHFMDFFVMTFQCCYCAQLLLAMTATEGGFGFCRRASSSPISQDSPQIYFGEVHTRACYPVLLQAVMPAIG